MIEKKNDYYNRLIDKFLEKLFSAFGSHLTSVTSFFQSENGSKPVLLIHLSETFMRSLYYSDNSCYLKNVSEVLRGRVEFPIYIITSNEIATFAENFPIELVHIKNRYRKCYGEDPIGQMNIDFNSLLNAVKISMHGILMHLRTAYLSQNYDDLFITEIMNRLYPVFEAALYLRSQTIPFTLSELVFKIEGSYNIKNSVLSRIAENMVNKNTKGIAKNMLKLLITLEKIFTAISEITES
jgi:hypothetical protein